MAKVVMTNISHTSFKACLRINVQDEEQVNYDTAEIPRSFLPLQSQSQGMPGENESYYLEA